MIATITPIARTVRLKPNRIAGARRIDHAKNGPIEILPASSANRFGKTMAAYGFGQGGDDLPKLAVPVGAKATPFNMLVADIFLGSPKRKPKG